MLLIITRNRTRKPPCPALGWAFLAQAPLIKSGVKQGGNGRCLVPWVAKPYCLPMETDSSGPPKYTLTEILFVVFLRMVAISCFWFGIEYWSMLVGYGAGGQARFDLLSPAWRAAGVCLAVVFPVAALGLWLTVSWGPVIWICAALGQVLMYTVWQHLFGSNILVPIMHATILTVYGLFRVALYLERREKRERVRTGLP